MTEITNDILEVVAEAIFSHWRFGALVEWVRRGNSLKQDEARDYARAALEAALPVIRKAVIEECAAVQDYREGPGPRVILRDLCDECGTKARTIAAYVLKKLLP